MKTAEVGLRKWQNRSHGAHARSVTRTSRTAGGGAQARRSSRHREHAARAPSLSRLDIFERVCRGGFPEAVRVATSRDRSEFFADYIRTISQRDIRELGKIGERVELGVVFRALAERTGKLVNGANLADAVRLTPETIRRYLPAV